LKQLLIIFCIFISFSSYSQYWADIDYSMLKQKKITINNISKEPLHCQLRVFNQKAYFEIDVSGNQRMSFKEDLKVHNISLYCKPIEKVTRKDPWIKQPYMNNNRPYISIFK